MGAACFAPSVLRPQAENTANTPRPSFGEFPANLHQYRRAFPVRCAELIKSHIGTSPSKIAVFFDIDEKTARDWLSGKAAPSGPFVAIICARIPGAAAYLLEAA